jgi:hypothetical protein
MQVDFKSLMSLQKQDGGLHPILCGGICRGCLGSLTINVTSVHNETVKLFTSTSDNFIQTTGIWDDPHTVLRSFRVFMII